MPRTQIKLTASFERNGRINPCDIIDLSLQGAGIRVNNSLVPGDKVNIIIGDHTLPSAVVRQSGNTVGLRFRELTNDLLNYIKWLCGKGGGGNPAPSEKEIVNSGIKTYVLKAETEKEASVLGLFLTALKKNHKGLVELVHLQNGAYQIKIYDISSSVASFEALLILWKAGDLIVR
jgi:hypothetical protein